MAATSTPQLHASSPRLGAGMDTGKAQQWIIVSAVLTAGMYFLRRMVESTGIGATTSKGKLSSILGSGAPAPLETWLVAYGVTYLGLAIVAMGAPELAAAFAILVVAVNGINNGITITADLGSLSHSAGGSAVATSPSTAADAFLNSIAKPNPAFGVAAPGKMGTPAAIPSGTAVTKSSPLTGWVP